MITEISGQWIESNLNMSDERLREIFSKAVNWLAQKTGDSRAAIIADAKDEVKRHDQMLHVAKPFRRVSIQYVETILIWCSLEFSTTHIHQSPETLAWDSWEGDSFCTFDTKGFEAFLDWLMN